MIISTISSHWGENLSGSTFFCRYFGKYKLITDPVSTLDTRSVMYERERARRWMDRKTEEKGSDKGEQAGSLCKMRERERLKEDGRMEEEVKRGSER